MIKFRDKISKKMCSFAKEEREKWEKWTIKWGEIHTLHYTLIQSFHLNSLSFHFFPSTE